MICSTFSFVGVARFVARTSVSFSQIAFFWMRYDRRTTAGAWKRQPGRPRKALGQLNFVARFRPGVIDAFSQVALICCST